MFAGSKVGAGMTFLVRLSTTLSLLLALNCDGANEHHEYTNDFAVEIDGDMTVADLVAGTHNLRLVRHVRLFRARVKCELQVAKVRKGKKGKGTGFI